MKEAGGEPDALRELDFHFLNDVLLLDYTQEDCSYLLADCGIFAPPITLTQTHCNDPLPLPCPSCGALPGFCSCCPRDNHWIDDVFAIIDSSSNPASSSSPPSSSPSPSSSSLDSCYHTPHPRPPVDPNNVPAPGDLVSPEIDAPSLTSPPFEETLSTALQQNPGGGKLRQLLYGKYQEQRRSVSQELRGGSPEEVIVAMKRLAETPPLYSKAKKSAKKREEEKSRVGLEWGTNLPALLVSCGEAVAQGDSQKARAYLQDLRKRASPIGNATQRMSHYFTEALVARLSGNGPSLYRALSNKCIPTSKLFQDFQTFLYAYPFTKIAYYFVNQNILEAVGDASRLHIVDYGILCGVQWHCLISCLAERKGGPPLLRITGIDFPRQVSPKSLPSSRLNETGKRLADYAQLYGIPFEYKAIAQNWENIEKIDLDLKEDEIFVVNCTLQLGNLMDEPEVVPSPREIVLQKVRSMNPKIFTVNIMNASLNAPFFISRFKEAVYYYSAMFDLYETLFTEEEEELRLLLERDQRGRDILNVAACEGLDRVVRPETYRQWHNRFKRVGLHPLPLDQRILSRAQHLSKCDYHKDFVVQDGGEWMLLGWKGRIMQALSTWHP